MLHDTMLNELLGMGVNITKDEVASRFLKLPELNFLNLGGLGLTSVPDAVFDNSINILDLSFNNLKELGDEFSSFNSLVSLSLRSNQFTSIPQIVYQMRNLKKLNVEMNKITEIKSLEHMNLFSLIASNNQINRITDKFPEELIHLDLHGNLLDDISGITSNCMNLNTLDVSNNRISQIQSLKIDRLVYIDLNTNNLDKLPPGIQNIPYYYVHNNSKTLDAQVLSGSYSFGDEFVLTNIFAKNDPEKMQQREMEIIRLGNELRRIENFSFGEI